MRYLASLALLTVLTFVAGCYDSEATGTASEPRDICGNGIDDDGDGFIDGADQDCWPADGGAPSVVDAGPRPAGDSGPVAPPAPRLVNLRIAWRSDQDLRFSQIQGCRYDGGACIVERFNLGTDAECAADLGTVVCRLSNVPDGMRFDFNAYGQRPDGTEVWGVGLDGAGAVRTVGTIFVSEDRDRDSTYDVDRTSAVRVVGITEGGGRNWSYVVGR